MPRGENEAFKKQQGRFARISKDELRKATSKGGSAKTMTMHDFKRMANEKDAEANPKNPGETKGDTILDRIQFEAASGNMKAAKLWMEIKQFGEPKNIDITSGGERLPDIKLEMPEGMGRLARSEDEIE
jgi:hypothetical protein